MTDRVVKTRFAPSPSGHLHVGGARTALYCWAYAHGRGGKFILRIEDTDQRRSSEAASLEFLRDLRWLGVNWDEGPEYDNCGGGAAGPYFQSQRLDLYNEHLERLLTEGKAYYAFETPEELEAKRADARKKKENYRYDRAALELSDDEVKRRLDAGDPAVVRLKVPDGPVTFRDEVRGETTVPDGELDDFVIRKADGYPTYHFAVVVDDELMGVTHVLRAEEHFKNTAKHVVLQNALGFARPVYAHLSVVVNPDGSKMSKRDKDKLLRQTVRERKIDEAPDNTVTQERFDAWLKDKDLQLETGEASRLASALEIALPEINIDDFRRSGYLPMAINNFLALNGWSPGGDVEQFDMKFFIERFDVDRLIKAPAKFDRVKLLSFNHDAIQALSEDDWATLLQKHCESYHPEFVDRLTPEQFRLFARANQRRSKTLEDPVSAGRFFIVPDDEITYDFSKATRKALAKGTPSGFDHLAALGPLLRKAPGWTVGTLEETVRNYAEKHAGGRLGDVAQPLRVAVSGGVVSPAIFETLMILGRDSSLRRIERCLSMRSMFSAD